MDRASHWRPASGSSGAKNTWRPIEAIRQLKSFVEAYALALAAFLAGDREVLFPAGTYRMVPIAGAASASPG